MAISGQLLLHSQMTALPVVQGFWFAWYAFHPDTRVSKALGYHERFFPLVGVTAGFGMAPTFFQINYPGFRRTG